MAGKSGRSINNIPESPIKKLIFGWEGILILVFVGVNIFCKWFSEYYNMFNLLRQMPVFVADTLDEAALTNWKKDGISSIWFDGLKLCCNDADLAIKLNAESGLDYSVEYVN